MSGEFFPNQHDNETGMMSEQSKRYQAEYEAEDRELEEALGNIWDIAEEFHLDPFPTHFEVVPATIINQIGAYGIPNRFSHWTHGRQYRQMKTQYDYGLSKIYELVINSNPSQAFLLENNPPIENKFVMAHVLGHTDFFKNNHTFARTRRDMPEAAARNAEKIHEYEEREGRLVVEKFLDAALAIEEHTDPYLPNRPHRDEELALWRAQAERANKPVKESGEFDDLFGPRAPAPTPNQLGMTALKIPPQPERDLIGFIRNHAPYIEDWQRNVLDIVRAESIYFYPQRRTKIMNEGWAAYWHKRIMREMGNRDLISDEESEVWWKVHSGVVQPNPRSLNPYYLGMKVYEYIEDYYNGNLSEKESAWLKKQDIPIHPHFEGELKDSPAMPHLRDAMMYNDDQSFIRNYFNKIIADRMGMYIHEEKTVHGPFRAAYSTKTVVKETGWQEIRDKLVQMLDNSGTPYIVVVDGDYKKSGELYLRHEFDGRTLDPEYIQKTLPYLHALWGRPVHLETMSGDDEPQPLFYTYDGEDIS